MKKRLIEITVIEGDDEMGFTREKVGDKYQYSPFLSSEKLISKTRFILEDATQEELHSYISKIYLEGNIDG